uniref:Uncharacterized protein n=1 Tax=Caenorhabditis japonica TaxID=281687 RepID=A0A8R1HPR0_CAEJA
MTKMPKISDKRKLLRNIFGPIVLMLCIIGAFAALIYGYSASNRWIPPTDHANRLLVHVYVGQKSNVSSIMKSRCPQIRSELWIELSRRQRGRLFQWSELTALRTIEHIHFSFLRMYEHALMLDDVTTLKFNKASTKIVDIVFRSALPIFATFAVGCGVSALHTIVTSVLKVCIRHKKYDAWTVGRNKMLRLTVVCCMAVALVYFAGCFVLASFAASKWQEVSFGDGMKISLNLISTIPPDIKVNSVTSAHTLAALTYFVHTATAYVIFCLVLLIKTWRISTFAIPLISDIDGANQVDKNVQVEYRKKRDDLFQRTVEKERKEESKGNNHNN